MIVGGGGIVVVQEQAATLCCLVKCLKNIIQNLCLFCLIDDFILIVEIIIHRPHMCAAYMLIDVHRDLHEQQYDIMYDCLK